MSNSVTGFADGIFINKLFKNDYIKYNFESFNLNHRQEINIRKMWNRLKTYIKVVVNDSKLVMTDWDKEHLPFFSWTNKDGTECKYQPVFNGFGCKLLYSGFVEYSDTYKVYKTEFFNDVENIPITDGQLCMKNQVFENDHEVYYCSGTFFNTNIPIFMTYSDGYIWSTEQNNPEQAINYKETIHENSYLLSAEFNYKDNINGFLYSSGGTTFDNCYYTEAITNPLLCSYFSKNNNINIVNFVSNFDISKININDYGAMQNSYEAGDSETDYFIYGLNIPLFENEEMANKYINGEIDVSSALNYGVYSQFPDKVDSRIFFKDINIDELEIMNNYLSLYNEGKYSESVQYLNDSNVSYYGAKILNIMQYRLLNIEKYLMKPHEKNNKQLYQVVEPEHTLGDYGLTWVGDTIYTQEDNQEEA